MTNLPPQSVTAPEVVLLPDNPTPVVYMQPSPRFLLNEADFLRLKSPGSLRSKLAPGFIGAGLMYAVSLVIDYLRVRSKPDAQIDQYGLLFAGALVLVGGGLWLAGTIWPGPRTQVVKKIESFFAQKQ